MGRLLLLVAGGAAGAVATAIVVWYLGRRRSSRSGALLSKLAHDLRTPLSSITAYTEILKDDEAIEPGERSRFLGIIHEEAARMETMLEDLTGARRSAAEDRPPVAPAPGASQRTILVVDDDRFLVEATCTLLSREGFTTVGAFDGREALAQARSVRPDMILMDMRMPGMTGEETLRHLRDDESTHEIPVIITTGDDASPALPGAAMLTKPVTRDRLIATIDAVWRASHTQRGAQG